jgi:thioredoxin reductase
VVGAHGTGRLEHLTLHDTRPGSTETVPAAALFILIGAQPRTEWLAKTMARDEHELVLTGRDLVQDGRPPAGWALGRLPGITTHEPTLRHVAEALPLGVANERAYPAGAADGQQAASVRVGKATGR